MSSCTASSSIKSIYLCFPSDMTGCQAIVFISSGFRVNRSSVKFSFDTYRQYDLSLHFLICKMRILTIDNLRVVY